MTYDLVVVGGGPAGTAAANVARAAGLRRVLLVDRAHFPRDKPCGGGLTAQAMSELVAAGLELRTDAVRPLRATLAIAGVRHEVPLDGTCAVVRRLEFDADLLAQAVAAGVELREGFAATTLKRGGDLVEIQSAGEALVARAVVLADGAAGFGRRALGLPTGRKAQLAQLDVPCSELEWARAQELLFNLSAEGISGYYWEFPCRIEGERQLNCGIYHLPSAKAPQDLASTLLRLLEVRNRQRGSRAVRNYSARLLTPGTALGEAGALLAGEALGVEGLAGEGISLALWTGAVAGKVTAKALRTGRIPQLSEYGRALRRTPVWSTQRLMHALGARLYGVRGPNYRTLASESPRTVRVLGGLLTGRFSALSAVAQLGPLYAYHRAFGALR